MDVDAGNEDLYYEDQADVDEEGDAHEDEKNSRSVSEHGQNCSSQRNRLRNEREIILESELEE